MSCVKAVVSGVDCWVSGLTFQVCGVRCRMCRRYIVLGSSVQSQSGVVWGVEFGVAGLECRVTCLVSSVGPHV